MADHGLRERKKQATRQLISNVATGMFIQRGFDQVTVAEIAEAAGVSKMTVFNYFPRKEDLFLDRHADRLAELTSVVSSRPAGVSPCAALRAHQHSLLASGHPLSGAIAGGPGFWWVLTSSPALMARWYEQEREIAAAFTSVFVSETGDAFRSRMVAGLLTTAIATIFSHAMERIIGGEDAELVRREQVAFIDEAFDLVENGVGDFPGA
ncbi:TetR/AcrR family transcriptional regulator [Amycolatopsis sp. FBCC-B4732]|uniref:TetR/AcrR family transcriptional regulator n=1 Tax=Amycolatopsis sp. FBCC-B4732 TaxID=3079339 RepID=UPI001FF65E6A|nr:TetR family transcriptional regulator [Amycolatopsis sp. FBCC-B4732]UOX92356.1 TetR/AcrR family transcriptional regulator [Amycolatopsis sp. FBCC-B4732]